MAAPIHPKILHPGFSRSIIPDPYMVQDSTIPVDEKIFCCEGSDACVVRLALAISYPDFQIRDLPPMLRASQSLSFCIMCIRHQVHHDPHALDTLYQDDPVIREHDASFLPPLRPSLHEPCIHIERIAGCVILPRRTVAKMVKAALDSLSTPPYYCVALFPQCKNTFMIFSRVELNRIG